MKKNGKDPCENITSSCGDNTDCFASSKAGATSKCKPAANYVLKLTSKTAKESQELTVYSTGVRKTMKNKS